MPAGEDAEIASASAYGCNLLRNVSLVANHHEKAVDMPHRKATPGGRRTRAHQQGARSAPGLWFSADVLQVEVLAAVIERLALRPDAFDDRRPLFGIIVAFVVLEQLRGEHA